MPEWTVIIFRSLGAVVMLFALTRILGKKQISQLTFFEYITGITLGELAGFISTDLEAHYLYGVIALLVWFVVPYSFELLTLKSRKLRTWLEGKGTVMIKNGKILEDNLKKERFSVDELMEVLRKKDVFKVSDVEYAVLEADGDLNVLVKKENMPLTPKTLGIKVAPESAPEAIIMDGTILDEPLSNLGFSRGWLTTELEKLGVAANNVFLAQVDAYGELYIDLFDDQTKAPKTETKDTLYATLKKCAADLELFALSTKEKEAKRMFEQCAEKMNRVVEITTPLLKR